MVFYVSFFAFLYVLYMVENKHFLLIENIVIVVFVHFLCQLM